MRTYSFVETILDTQPLSSSGLSMVDDDFEFAYKTAGTKFTGQLEELFLVLSDSSKHVVTIVRQGARSKPRQVQLRGSKRNQPEVMEDADETSSKNSRTTSLARQFSGL